MAEKLIVAIQVILLLSTLTAVFARFTHCGQRDMSRTMKIVGGEDSKKGEFPWQAAMRWRTGVTKGDHICGGSLILANYVLTAAHCFEFGVIPNYYTVTLGALNRGTTDNEQTRDIKRIIIHHRYNPKTQDNDIALIELKRPIILNNYINTICLPTFRDLETPNTVCTISGWGGTLGDKEAAAKILQRADVPIVKFSTCNDKKSYNGKLTENMFCAGFPDGRADSCQGDSGGPLQCKSKATGYFRLQGVTSFGDGCGVANKYGVYTVVRHYLFWIKDKTRVHPFTPPKPKHPPTKSKYPHPPTRKSKYPHPTPPKSKHPQPPPSKPKHPQPPPPKSKYPPPPPPKSKHPQPPPSKPKHPQPPRPKSKRPPPPPPKSKHPQPPPPKSKHPPPPPPKSKHPQPPPPKSK